MSRSTRSATSRLVPLAGTLASLLVSPGVAVAQRDGIELDRYQAAETTTDDFALSRPTDLGHLQWDAQVHIDYAHDPLVYETKLGDADTETSSVVEHQIVAQLGVAVGIADRLVLFAGLPFVAFTEGEGAVPRLPAVGGSALGDPRIGARVRLLGGPEERFALGAQLGATLPVGQAVDEEQMMASSETWTLHPELLAELRTDQLRVTLDAGARVRGEDTSFDTLQVGHEITFGVGAAMPIVDQITGHLQIFGSTDLDRALERANTPLEALLGAKLDAGEGWHAGVAAGTGLTRGYGSPDLRLVLSIGHTSRYERAAPPEPAPPPDTDGDGMTDDVDGCPTEAEDPDSFQDEDGCPDPDNDADQVPDDRDGAPNDPEDRDQFQDEDGVPDPDNDGDGLADAQDRCPNEAEDVDQVADEDGCPETDADSDTVLDPQDKCPMTPGLADHQNPDCVGCPALACTIEGSIQILQRVEFETDSDVLLPESDPVLQAVREILATNTLIRKIRVEGHTDDRGNDEHNLDLSRRRAQSVRRWLVEHEIEDGRLESEGFGETRPLVPNQGARNRRTNRRVEFRIVDPAPPAAETAPAPAEGAAPAPAPAPAAPSGGAP